MTIIEKLKKIFTYHPPKNDQIERYGLIREKAYELALLITEKTPESKEQEIALNHLKTAIMWANSAIAINE